MAYRLTSSKDLAQEIQRVVEEQIDGGLGDIDDEDMNTETTIHQVRKRCKKIRAVLRLARGPLRKDDAFDSENTWFRDIARELSVLRDADALIGTHDALVAAIHSPDVRIEYAAVRGQLTARRRQIAEREGSLDARLQAARGRLLEGRERVPDWAWRVRNFRGLEPGLRRTYRRGKRAMAAAYESRTDEAFHDFRKRTKYHWYACRLLRDIWPDEMDARRASLNQLSELLGDEHDLTVYRATLDEHPQWFGKTTRRPDILAAVDRRRDALRRDAYPLGLRLYAEKPRQLSARLEKYWQAWQTERGLTQAN